MARSPETAKASAKAAKEPKAPPAPPSTPVTFGEPEVHEFDDEDDEDDDETPAPITVGEETTLGKDDIEGDGASVDTETELEEKLKETTESTVSLNL
jgi:hypothetical protein